MATGVVIQAQQTLPKFQERARNLRPIRMCPDEHEQQRLQRRHLAADEDKHFLHLPHRVQFVWSGATREADHPLRFAVALRETNALIGTVGFHSVSARHRSAELAYDLAPDFWGQGIATWACALMTEWAHRHASVVRVQATVLQGNQRSINVLERCRFVREGLLRSYRMVRGLPGDFWMYSHVEAGGRCRHSDD